MSVEAINNPPPAGESKSARKKREKAEAAAQAEIPQSNNEEKTPDAAQTNGDSYFESSYIKELQKSVRNVNKKLNAMTKLDALLAEHPGVPLDDLVATRKINADQRAQAQKKPGLMAQLAQLEEQISQYKKIDAEYQSRMTSQQSQLTSTHQSELEQLKASLQQEHDAELKSALRQKLLTFSQFLRAAAAKRVIEEEADTDESKAFEGALLLVYGGDDKAVDAALNLIEGSDEQVPSVEGQLLPVNYGQVKQAAVSYGAFPGEEPVADAPAEATIDPVNVQPKETVPSSDPTIAHAGLTELGLNQPADQQLADAAADAEAHPIAEAAVGDELANKSAGASWDTPAANTGSEEQLDESFEMVPRDISETETVHEPAQPQSTNSWADQTSAPANAVAQPDQTNAQPAANGATPAADDGFLAVERRGGRGGHRGDGRGRGRGRGGPRGGHRGGFRGRGGPEGRGGRGRGGASQAQAAPRS